MGLFKRRKKEKEKKETSTIGIDYRISPYNLFQILVLFALMIMCVAWSSIILLSFLYFLSFASVMILLIYGREASKKGAEYGKWFYGVLAVALLFFALSLNPSDLAYFIGAYGSSAISPLLAYIFLRKEMKNHIMAEVYGYGE